MRDQLLDIYPDIPSDHVCITGTPQFDFYFKPEFCLSKEALCRRIGADPARPLVLYTTGIAHHFPEEHRTVEHVIRVLRQLDIHPRPQLIVRTYVKDTSPEMFALAERYAPDAIFPKVEWEKKWFTPLRGDLAVYTSLIRHAVLGINAASTVSLELLMQDTPVINLGFDPPGSDLPHWLRWRRHIEFDHYRPVAESRAVMVAGSVEELDAMLEQGLKNPQIDSEKRRAFIAHMFGDTLDGNSGRRVAMQLLRFAGART